MKKLLRKALQGHPSDVCVEDVAMVFRLSNGTLVVYVADYVPESERTPFRKGPLAGDMWDYTVAAPLSSTEILEGAFRNAAQHLDKDAFS